MAFHALRALGWVDGEGIPWYFWRLPNINHSIHRVHSCLEAWRWVHKWRWVWQWIDWYTVVDLRILLSFSRSWVESSPIWLWSTMGQPQSLYHLQRSLTISLQFNLSLYSLIISKNFLKLMICPSLSLDFTIMSSTYTSTSLCITSCNKAVAILW